MINFVSPINTVVASGSPYEQVLIVTGTVTEMKPGRLVKKGAFDEDCVIGAADGLSVGWLGFEQTFAPDQPADITTAYALNARATVLNGPGVHIMAESSAAIAKGARVAATTNGKVVTWANTMDADAIVGIAEESIAGAGKIRIRSLI